MKVVILAGGFGTRLGELTEIVPKPMVEIGDKPILWHIMKIYSVHGFNDFIICLGYKGDIIKKYFYELYTMSNNITIDTINGSFTINKNKSPNWKVSLIDTGLNTTTGGRLLRVQEFIDGEAFMMTYGDGLANIDLNKLLQLHKSHGKIATITAVHPPPRFGILNIAKSGQVISFSEKPEDSSWINGGFFVLNKEVFKYISKNEPYFEGYPLSNLAKDGELYAYKHHGFWRPMDTLSDKKFLEDLWNTGKAEWKIWND
ncbi:MAG: glucose-1-phosphate cytidylyltransferase [Nitrososphaerota archaeon]|jgi:glucose-1-phosphate cytidylyltransferase|nr:glucose-1-phosphate cytidylyltransferase [Nitrososphaerota archaeon]MDG7040091.1 glucose-1-phosphate cytidylyltransferase [Nitrososphaerota archaeon]